jgi:hypothetical protein
MIIGTQLFEFSKGHSCIEDGKEHGKMVSSMRMSCCHKSFAEKRVTGPVTMLCRIPQGQVRHCVNPQMIASAEAVSVGKANFFFIHIFRCTYIVWVISLPCPHPPSYHSLASRQNLFCSFLQVFEEKT